MVWLGQKRKWTNEVWNGKRWVKHWHPKQRQLQTKPTETELSFWGKVKRFFGNLNSKLFGKNKEE